MFLGPFMHQSATVVALISQMITPAIFILATGTLVNATIARVARVVDRTRDLLAKLAEDHQDPEEREEAIAELGIYKRRSTNLESALTSYFAAIGLFVASSLFVAISAIVSALVWLPTLMTVVGSLLVLIGSIFSLVEVRLGTGVVRRRIDRHISWLALLHDDKRESRRE